MVGWCSGAAEAEGDEAMSEFLRGQIQAYWTVSEYLSRVDDRIRLNEFDREGRYKAKRRVIANADKWLMGRIHELNEELSYD